MSKISFVESILICKVVGFASNSSAQSL